MNVQAAATDFIAVSQLSANSQSIFTLSQQLTVLLQSISANLHVTITGQAATISDLCSLNIECFCGGELTGIVQLRGGRELQRVYRTTAAAVINIQVSTAETYILACFNAAAFKRDIALTVEIQRGVAAQRGRV